MKKKIRYDWLMNNIDKKKDSKIKIKTLLDACCGSRIDSAYFISSLAAWLSWGTKWENVRRHKSRLPIFFSFSSAWIVRTNELGS